MAACVLTLLLTAVLCLGGRQPGVADTTDTIRVDLKRSGVQATGLSSDRQLAVNIQSTISKLTEPSIVVGSSQSDGDMKLTTKTLPVHIVATHILMSSKPSRKRHKRNMSPKITSAGPTALDRPQDIYSTSNEKQTTTKASENDTEMSTIAQFSLSATVDNKEKYDGHRRPETIPKKQDLTSVSAAPRDLSCSPCQCTRTGSKGVIADCSARGLTKVPTSLPAKVTELAMAENRLHSLTDGAFSGLPNLMLLDLSSNLITNMSTEAFKGLPNLQALHLHGNELRYTPEVLTAEILASLRSLRHLTLHNNTDDMAEDLDYPHLALSRLPLLEELSLDGLTNRTFGDGFANLTNLKTLTLSGIQGFCELQTVSNQTFLTLAPLRNLFIVKCDLLEIEKGTFLPLQNIDTLDISKNTNLGIDEAMGATYGLQASSIRVFYANEIDNYFTPCIFLTVEHLRYFANTNIEELHIEINDIQAVEKNALLVFQHNLKRLYARGNRFLFGSYWLDLVRMQNLELIHVGMDGAILPLPARPQVLYKYIDDEARGKRTNRPHTENHIFPSKKRRKRYSEINPMEGDPRALIFPIPRNLKQLSFRGSLMRTVLSAITFSPHNSLHNLDASVNFFRSWIGPIGNLHQLKVFNLSQNYADQMNLTVFSDLPNLQTLDISHNLLSDVFADKRSVQIFRTLKFLRHFNVSFNGLSVIHEGLLRELPSLVTLHLAGNKFMAKDFMADLSLMPNLTVLDLSSNSFEGLSQNIRLAIDKLTAASNASLTLNLLNNPLACTCGNLDFLRWLHKAHVQLVQAEEQQCIYENASHVPLWAGLEELEASCGERGLLFAGSALAFVLLCAVIVGLVLYRYRWKLRYLYYIHRGRYMQELVTRIDFRYDVFLSFDNDDYEWVAGQLLPHLEAQGLRVCFHQRDFLPGRPIAALIVEAVQTSRRTVCVLSPNFLDSQWCLYEMQMAILEGVHSHRDVLLLLVYEHVGPQALPREVLHYYQTDSYLEYPRDARCLPFFWENLTLALR